MSQARSKNDNKQDILSKDMWQLMLKLTPPGIIGMSVNAINTFVDAVYVGQFIDQDALAAISLVFPLLMITGAFSVMIGVGSSSLLSRAIGANDTEVVKKIFGNLNAMSLIVTMLIAIPSYIYASELIAFLGGSEKVVAYGTIYYRVLIIGTFLRVYSVSTNMLIRAEGALKEAMTYAGLNAVVNMIFCPIFILVFDMGIAGAAWATNVAMLTYSLLNIRFFAKGKGAYNAQWKSISLDFSILPNVLSVGGSAMLLQLMFFIQQTAVFKSVAYYGNETDIAFMGAVYRIVMLTIVPVFGFVQALQPVVGINYGAENYLRVKEAFIKFTAGASILMSLVWLPLMIFPEGILSIILPNNSLSAEYIMFYRVMVILLPVLPIYFCGISFYQSMGEGKLASVVLISRQVVLFIPVVLILPKYFGLGGVFFSAPIVDLFLIVVLLFLLSNRLSKLNTMKQAVV
ncbi:MATE family efflux transporter [Chondrinema litorale]|uniref:MATE family efflux transporter n=1 Tax=Chondrinema litorale TaxID=2994555 RepID=UPI002543218F|nr:MATE family efflux transporter [Chondrinema litorale]UZR92702.1 MATE family efflux transporter [Chondrinema litorale]